MKQNKKQRRRRVKSYVHNSTNPPKETIHDKIVKVLMELHGFDEVTARRVERSGINPLSI